MTNLGKIEFNQVHSAVLQITSKKGENTTAVVNVTNYIVENGEQLKELATAVNTGTTFLSKTIYQTKTIDLSSICGSDINKSWEPIGSKIGSADAIVDYYFDGIFDGNNKTISGIYINNNDTKTVGLFGLVGVNGEIKNLTVEGDITNNIWRGTGGICGRNEGSIKNCTNLVNVKGINPVGGITGMNEGGNVENCINSVKVTGDKQVGGICGSNNGNVKLCTNSAQIEANSSITGGIVGNIPKNGTIESCKNTGNVTSKGCPETQVETQGTGGILGRIEETATIIKCANKGNITALTGFFAGGIVGFVMNGSIEQCYNTECNIYSKMNGAAGIVGRFDNGVIKNCYNYFSSNDYYIKSETGRAGGITCNVSGVTTQPKIENSYYIGENIIGKLKGSVMGHCNTSETKIINCYVLSTSEIPEIGINKESIEPAQKEITPKTEAKFKANKSDTSSVVYMIDKNNGADKIWDKDETNGGYPYLKNAPHF